MENFLQKISDSVGAQLHGMNSSIVKMKEEDDRYKQVNERFTNFEKKILDIDKNTKARFKKSRERMLTGIRVRQCMRLQKESFKEIGMTMENARNECPAKPITHAFIHLKNDEERNKFVRSANMLKKELRGRKLKVSRSMDADERFHHKTMVYVKNCIHEKHNIPLDSITTNWTLKHTSVKGQIVVKTCQNGTLTYIKHHEVEEQMETWQSKNSSQRQ